MAGLRTKAVGLAIVALLMVTMLAPTSPRASADAPRQDSPAFIVSAKSGPWSQAKTWVGGKVPGAGSRVRVAEGHTVTYDVQSDQVIRMIHVAGTLTFAHDRSTRLDVGLIRIQEGQDCGEDGFDCEAHMKAPDAHKARPALEIGTRDKPICEAGDKPIVIVFARTLSEPLGKMVNKIDKALAEHKSAELRAWVTFLADNQPAFDPKVVDWGKKSAAGAVPLGIFEDVVGPPAYLLNRDADVTVLLAVKQKVVANFAFRAGELNDAAIGQVFKELPKIVTMKQ